MSLSLNDTTAAFRFQHRLPKAPHRSASRGLALTLRRLSVAAGLTLSMQGTVLAQTPNMDAGLTSLVRTFKAGPSIRAENPNPLSFESAAQRDVQGRVLVEIRLDGTVSIERFRQTLISLGGNITGEDPYYRFGTFSAFVPMGSMDTLGAASGVGSVSLSYRPMVNAGLVQSQGTKVIGSDVVNTGGLKGMGITVGILSDSFDKSSAASTNAWKDRSTGDLPLTMKLVNDFGGTAIVNDEGRAMAQIVHDVAPNADLCFETAFSGKSAFASNIRDLRTNPLCQADVIVDDVSYLDEPFFADGQLAQAVDDVATSKTLAGKKVRACQEITDHI
jgi:hypothetical protein